jgi:hypothetical protein
VKEFADGPVREASTNLHGWFKQCVCWNKFMILTVFLCVVASDVAARLYTAAVAAESAQSKRRRELGIFYCYSAKF